MSKTELDPEDIGMLVLGIFSAAVMVGIASVEVFSFSLSDSFTVGGYTASIAWVATVGTFVGTIFTNEHTELFSTDAADELLNADMSDAYAYAVIAAAALLVAWVFVPQVSDFIAGSDVWGLGYVGLVTASQLTIGWIY